MDRRPGMCCCCDAPRGVSRAPRRLPDGTTQHLIISHVADGRLIALFQIAHPGRAYPFPALFLWFKSPRDPACPCTTHRPDDTGTANSPHQPHPTHQTGLLGHRAVAVFVLRARCVTSQVSEGEFSILQKPFLFAALFSSRIRSARDTIETPRDCHH